MRDAPLADVDAISFDGSVIVGKWATPKGYQLFRWTKSDGWRGIDITVNQPLLLSQEGNVIAGSGGGGGSLNPFDKPGQAFLWTQDKGIIFLDPSSRDSRVTAMSADGTILAGTRRLREEEAGGPQEKRGGIQIKVRGQSAREALYEATPFIWTEASGPQDLPLEGYGWALIDGMAADGSTIWGWVRNRHRIWHSIRPGVGTQQTQNMAFNPARCMAFCHLGTATG